MEDETFHKVFDEYIFQIELEMSNYMRQLVRTKNLDPQINHLKASYITNIFKLCFQRVNVALGIIPKIMADFTFLERNCGTDNAKLIRKLLSTYFSQSEEFNLKSMPRDLHCNNKFLATIDTLRKFNIHEIGDKVTTCTFSVNAELVVSCLQQLEIIAIHDILMQAVREMAKERVLHRMWKANEENIGKNRKLSQLIANKEKILEQDNLSRQNLINEHEQDVAKLVSSNAKELRAKIIESYNRTSSVCSQMRLKEKAIGESLTLSVEENRLSEQMIRKFENEEKLKKSALEERIQNVLRKYDNEISARCHKLQKLGQTLDRNNRVLSRWQAKYAKQDKIYRQIVEEMEAEEIRIREEKMLLFMMNRSAVIIQRAFREIMSKKKSKKKKGKKGRK